jgi:hypothetical protein
MVSLCWTGATGRDGKVLRKIRLIRLSPIDLQAELA